MSLPVAFRQVVRTEFNAAADWYEERRSGLGVRFTAAVQIVLDRTVAQPDFYPLVWNEVREALVHDFPYCVYYRTEPGQVLVLAVFHTPRNPAVWQRRT